MLLLPIPGWQTVTVPFLFCYPPRSGIEARD